MKLLLYSPAFLPLVGGLEINTANLAGELVRLGQEVVVVTRTPADGPDGLPFRVVRDPSWYEIVRQVRWCDVFIQQNVSLRGLWPLLLVRRPWVVSHHSWYCRPDGRIAWQDRLKRWLLRFAAGSIAVSRAIAADLRTPAEVIPNAYRHDLFRRLPGIERGRDLVFVGRLVSDKGVDLLLDALALLAERGLYPRLTLVGDGPERPALAEQASRLGLAERIDFAGTQTGDELVRTLNEHRILVIPSRYDEPFGIVALEGIACGCVVVGSAGGGLKEAIGTCGFTFRNGDTAGLANHLEPLLLDTAAGAECLAGAAEHLARHCTERVARAYLRIFEEAAARRS
jgi:glycosyltransferase involved in cell wall biosynthesis